jgi:hypothetical protein
VAAVQYTFTHKQYTEGQKKTIHRTAQKTIHRTTQKTIHRRTKKQYIE